MVSDFGVLLKNNFAYSSVTKMMPLFFLWKLLLFYLLYLTIFPFCLGLIFIQNWLLCMIWGGLQYIFFSRGYLLVSTPFIKKIILFFPGLQCQLCCKSGNQICVDCFWTLFYSVLLVSFSILLWISYCLNYYNFITDFINYLC